ncbi:MAG: PilT/PilU family type 4a pilus ATPase [bacterium]
MNYNEELKELLGTVVQDGGSDLHLSEGRRPTIRISGQLIPLMKKENLTHADIEGLLKIMLVPKAMATFLDKKEIDFAYDFGNQGRFRGNAFVQKGFFSIVLRLIPKNIKSIAELNLPTILENFARKEQGFFLIVGPVGMGKTTTLAAMIELVNQERAAHIITIEDPIEYVYEQKKAIIDQREVGIDTDTFASGLQSVFRQDVNVLLIGEMRGPDTMAAAVTAAETGHLVFSTLHTNNAAQTIDRIIDTFPSEQQDQIRIQLAASLIGIFSQRLIPRIAGGMVPAYELLIANNAVSNLIREKRTHEINTVIETSLQEGMIDLNRSLADLVRKGEISIENAYQHSVNSKILEKYL